MRASDARARDLVTAIGDRETERCVFAERALLAALRADCHSPMAALATVTGGELRLRAELLSEDGSESVAGDAQGGAAGDTLARDLLARAPDSIRRLFAG